LLSAALLKRIAEDFTILACFNTCSSADFKEEELLRKARGNNSCTLLSSNVFSTFASRRHDRIDEFVDEIGGDSYQTFCLGGETSDLAHMTARINFFTLCSSLRYIEV
jgi:hypothetical protein